MKHIFICTIFIWFQVLSCFGKQHIVEMTDTEFRPSKLNIAVGDTVTWISKSEMQHTSTSGSNCSKDGKWNSGIIDAGEKYIHVFKSAGSFPYFCVPHCAANMVGTINVSASGEGKNTQTNTKQDNDGSNEQNPEKTSDQNTNDAEAQPEQIPAQQHNQHQHQTLKPAFRNTRIVNAQSVETLKKGTLEFRVVHRWDDIIGPRGGGHSLFGLDNLRDERLSFEYGITNNLLLGFGRCKGDYGNNKVQQVYELYDLFAKYRLLRQDEEKNRPVSIAIHANSVMTTMKPRRIAGSEANFDKGSDRFSFAFQPIVARKFSDRLSIEILPTYIRRNWAQNGDEKDLFSIGAGGSLYFTKRFGIVAEYFYTFSDYRKNSLENFYNPLAFGVEFYTGGHIFTINLSNATGIIENTFIPYTTASWLKSQFRLGFSIHRKFNLNKKNKA